MMEGRRTGKTSVAIAALDRIHSGRGRVAAATLTRFTNDRDVAIFLGTQLQSTARRGARSLVNLVRALDRTPAKDLIGTELTDEIAAGTDVAESALKTSEDLAQLIETAGRGGTTAILLDEAQAMLDWPARSRDSLNAVLRGELHVGVVVASSDTEALERLTQRGGPLHLVGSRVALPAISKTQWLGALRDRYADLHIEIGEQTIATLIDLAASQPYLTMRLARDTARIASDGPSPWVASPAVLEAAFYELQRDPVWSALGGSGDR